MIELPRSKLAGYQTNRESLTQLSPPHVSSGGLVLTSPGFPCWSNSHGRRRRPRSSSYSTGE